MLSRPTTPVDRLFAGLLTLVLLTVVAVSFLTRNRAVIEGGGSEWIHGEWLINFAAGPVRRGLGGTVVLGLSEVFGTSPLAVIEVLQGGAVIGVILGVVLVLLAKGAPVRMCILALSPAFMLTWHNAFGTHGKEIFACLPFVPLLLAALTGRAFGLALILAILLHGLAILLHETSVLFFPFLMVSGLSLIHRGLPRQQATLFAVGLTAVASAGTGFTLLNMSVPSAEPICAALTARGLSETLCGTPIAWVSNSGPDALAFTLGRLPDRDWLGIAATAILAYAPLWIILRPALPWRWILIGTALTILAFLPLYLVAVDYGRWLNMQIAAISLTLLVIAATGWRDLLVAPMTRSLAWGLIALTLLWRVSLVSGGIGSGMAEPLVKAMLGV